MHLWKMSLLVPVTGMRDITVRIKRRLSGGLTANDVRILVFQKKEKVYVAAKDKYCGALHYINYDPWIKRKNMEVYLEGGELEAVQLVQQGYHELRRFDGEMSVLLGLEEKIYMEPGI